MTCKKSVLPTLSIALVMTGCLSAPVHAAFFLEGLEPFSMRHCDDTRLPADADMSLSDPVVLSPAEMAEAEQQARRDFRPPCPQDAPGGAPGKYTPLPPK
jgi:hypothetical protein